MDSTNQHICPHCGSPLPAEPMPVAVELTCPECGGRVIIPGADGRLDVIDDSPVEPEPEPPPEDRLDEQRVRRVAAIRRSVNRSLSHCMIGFLACVVVAVQLAWNLTSDLRTGRWDWASWVYLLLLACCAVGAVLLLQRAARLQREIDRT